MNYIKINAVLNRVPIAIKEESDNSTLLSYALDAYRLLNITQYNMETVAFIDIVNNQGQFYL